MKPLLTPHRIVLLVASCLMTLTSGCQHSSPRSVPLWGGIVNPSGACTVIWTNQMIEMSLPPGIYDLSPYQRTENLAPRVMRPVKGNFVAEVKVTGDFDPGNQPIMRGRAAFFGAGLLLLWQGSTNYLRLERNEWSFGTPAHSRHGPLLEHWVDGKNRVSNPTLSEPYFQGDSTWLRLTRQGNQITSEVSHDGKVWLPGRTITAEFDPTVEIGVDAITTSAKPFHVTFSDFRVKEIR